MSFLTTEHLQIIDAARGACRHRCVIYYGQLRCCLVDSPHSSLHNCELLAVLDDTRLSFYENESNWRQGFISSHHFELGSITSVEWGSAFLEIVVVTARTQQRERVRLSSSNRRNMQTWQELLSCCLLGSRSLRSFASHFGLSLKASVLEVLDRLKMIFGNEKSCFSLKGWSSCKPLSRVSSLYKRMFFELTHRDAGNTFQLQRKDCSDLEKAILDEISDRNNNDELRRCAIQLLWIVCCCVSHPPSSKFLSCHHCSLGARKFLLYVALLSKNQIPEQAISEGILDVLLQRDAAKSNCVKEPGAWSALFVVLAAVSADHRQKLLRSINFLLIDNVYNCSTLALQSSWKHMVYSGMIADRAGFDIIVALSLNILVIISYNALINTNRFVTTINDTIDELQLVRGPDIAWHRTCCTFLASLSNKIVINFRSFPSKESQNWTQIVLFGNVILTFIFGSGHVDLSKTSQLYYQALSEKPPSFPNLIRRLRWKKNATFDNVQSKLGCLRGDFVADEGDLILIDKMVLLYETFVNTIQELGASEELSEYPYILYEAEFVKKIFSHISNAIRNDETSKEIFQNHMISK